MAEHTVGAASTFLNDGSMTRLELEGKPVVVARAGGQYYAFGGKCTHYGGPLDKGVLKGHTLMCPWHHACFDIRSGERLEPPAYNDLPRYPVRLDGDQIIVTLPHDNQTQPQGKAEPSDARVFLIIGGGAAGNAAAEQLRRSGFRGKIVVISAVPETPVDRPNLSKDYLDGHAKPEWIPLRDADWYAARDIQLHLDTTVAGVDPAAHTVTLDNGATHSYDKLLLATGATPRKLNIPGADLVGVLALRSLGDAEAIIQAAQSGKQAVVIGASFIGMEVAAALASGRGIHVTVVGMEAAPFEPILGDRVGRLFQSEHEANGVQFRLSTQVKRFLGENNHVRAVELRGGETLPADFVVLGVGVIPATGFLKTSGLNLQDKDGSVLVNARLQTSHPDIFAAGDIAHWDDGSEAGARIEHWRVAQQQGMVAARNMLGGQENINQHVPFFWTNQWKIGLRYVGYAPKWDEIIYRGAPEAKDYIAFYVADGKLRAAAGYGHDREMDAIEFILRDGMSLSPAQMRDAQFDLVAYASGATISQPPS
jgi:NADPH-dependent 2,4-dienoyl-CoA reductase/sulfur reductase-like enzyme/nitrite reductase/ring-hydroxylating ferredoxin subunit